CSGSAGIANEFWLLRNGVKVAAAVTMRDLLHANELRIIANCKELVKEHAGVGAE
ncbi:unnamed protein product, partial [Ceratitis capitata]